MCACGICRFMPVNVCTVCGSSRFVWCVCLACIVWGSLCACVMCRLFGRCVCVCLSVRRVVTGLVLPPHFALWVWLPVVCCPLVVWRCSDRLRSGLPSNWDLGWVHLRGAVGPGVHVQPRGAAHRNVLVSPGRWWAPGTSGVCPCLLIRPVPGYMGVNVFTCTWSCVYCSELSVCAYKVVSLTQPGSGQTLPGQLPGLPFGGMGHLGSLCSWEHPLTQTSVSLCRILTGCWGPCRLRSPRTRVPASCSAASAARAGPRPPWWWLCLPPGTSEYVWPPV